MELNDRKISGREKDEDSIRLLEQLRKKLYLENIDYARRAAFRLSWMQEDGLDILKEALLGNTPRITKIAAAYGMRSMHGRMKTKGLETIREGLYHSNKRTREVCRLSLTLLKARASNQQLTKKKGRGGKFRIKAGPSANSRQRSPRRTVHVSGNIKT